MPPEVIEHSRFTLGKQPDGSIITKPLTLSSDTWIEHKPQGFSYFTTRVEATYFVHNILPYVEIPEDQRNFISDVVRNALPKLFENSREEVIEIRFNQDEATCFDRQMIRFRDSRALRDAFLKVLPQATIKGFEPAYQEDFSFTALNLVGLNTERNVNSLKEFLSKILEGTKKPPKLRLQPRVNW